MGATTFYKRAKGATPKEAFDTAREEAARSYGSEGYTGTIAEKSKFTMIPLPEGRDPVEYADELIDKGDRRVDDKWGPAGCLDLGAGSYLFFGWASE